MPTVDTTAAVLAALAKQGAPARAVEAAENFRAQRENVVAQRYARDREAEELAAARAAVVDGLREANVEADLLTDRRCDDALAQWDRDRAARAAERRTLADAIDVSQLRATDDLDEVARLVADAEAAGDIVGAQARHVALTRIRPLAAAEQRCNRINGPAFRLLVRLSEPCRGTERADVEQRFAREKARNRELTMEVARAIGVADELRRAFVVAEHATPAPEATSASTMKFGAFWDRYPQFISRR